MPNYSRTGGILTIISGAWSIFYIAMALMYILLFQWMSTAPEFQKGSKMPPEVMLAITIIAAIFALFFALAGALAIVGGVFALKKKRWAWSLAGAIAGAFLLFPTGIAGTILVTMGKSEFLVEGTSPDPAVSNQTAIA